MTLFAQTMAGFSVILGLGLTAAPVGAQVEVTTPEEAFGFQIGADYQLATYAQLTGYWQTLARESDRMRLESIGQTAEGRDQWMAIITSPENHRLLDRYQEIAQRLARAEGLSDDEARALAAEGKAVVWIDGGLHATEVLGAQQLIELVYQMVSGTDPETLRFLDDVILLAVHCNPDGHDLVADWYLREPDPEQRTTRGLPRLYQKYVGHDNNRDFYMSVQPETTNMNRVLYREWFPQIVYNHHQSGPAGAVLFAPPFRGPFNYVYDPLIPLGLDLIGASMHSRFAVEGKPGATMTRGGTYSTWWNGGLRTTPYFHNMLGLLTEMIGNPTPIEIPFLPERQLPSVDTPYPLAPQPWHFRQSIEYSMSANRAVLDVASRHREQFLFNIYRMGRNSIERGSQDTWTTSPSRVAQVQAAIADAGPDDTTGQGRRRGATCRGGVGGIQPGSQVLLPRPRLCFRIHPGLLLHLGVVPGCLERPLALVDLGQLQPHVLGSITLGPLRDDPSRRGFDQLQILLLEFIGWRVVVASNVRGHRNRGRIQRHRGVLGANAT